MLFGREDLQRHRVDERGGLETARRKTRFPPIRHGKFTLVRIELVRHKSGPHAGLIKVFESNRYKAITAQCHVAEGNQMGRWFFEDLVIAGHDPSERRLKENMRTIAGCFERDPTSMRRSALDGLIVPIMIEQYEDQRSGRIKNRMHAIGPHPDHPDHDAYHELVSRCMKVDEKLGGFVADVPGWDLYPDSKTYRLVQKRMRDAHEAMPVTGLTRLEARRQANSLRAVERFTEAA